MEDKTGLAEVGGWISNLTKYTASARMNFDADASDEEILLATLTALFEELRNKGRADEAGPGLWELKDPIKRVYAVAGKSSARIRLRRTKYSPQQAEQIAEAMMQEAEAREIIEYMLATAISDTVTLTQRISELEEEYKTDAWDVSAVQIKRLKARLAARVREADALAVAVTKFEGTR